MKKSKKESTSTRNIARILDKGMVTIGSAEYIYVFESTKRMSYGSADVKMLESNIKALSQAGIFADVINWKYQLRNNAHDAEEDIMITGKCDDHNVIVVLHIDVNDGITLKNVDELLQHTVFNEFMGKKYNRDKARKYMVKITSKNSQYNGKIGELGAKDPSGLRAYNVWFDDGSFDCFMADELQKVEEKEQM